MFGNDDDFSSSKKRGGIDIKRFIGFNLLALVLAFGANFIGVTSFVLSNTNPEYFKSLKLDEIYSINNYLRIVKDDYMYIYPDNWIADQRLQVAAIRNRELPNSIQKSIPSSAHQRSGSVGKLENVSVVKSKLLPGFTLEGTLGTPDEAAKKLMAAAAPLPKVPTLINIYDESRNGQQYYILEYLVQKPETTFNQHIISVITSRNNELYTMTVQVPNEQWEDQKEVIRAIANSFEVVL